MFNCSLYILTQNCFISLTLSLTFVLVWACYVVWFCKLLPVMAGVMKQQEAAAGRLIRQQHATLGPNGPDQATGTRWQIEGSQAIVGTKRRLQSLSPCRLLGRFAKQDQGKLLCHHSSLLAHVNLTTAPLLQA